MGTPTPEQQRYVDFSIKGEPMHRIAGGVLRLMATKTRSDPAAPLRGGHDPKQGRVSAECHPELLHDRAGPAAEHARHLAGVLAVARYRPLTATPVGRPRFDILEAPLNDKWDTDNMLTLTTPGAELGR